MPALGRRPLPVNIGILIFVCLYAAIVVAQPNYLEPGLAMNFLRRAAPLVVLAIGALYVIVVGGFDLSVGSTVTLVVLAASILINGDPSRTWPVILLLYAVGFAIGLANGLIVAFLKVPSIIATLGMMLILKGLSLVISGTKPIYFNGTPSFPMISTSSLIGAIIPGVPIPNGVLILFLVAGATSYILGRTVLGRYCFALGSNEEAVRLSGVNTDGWKMAIYALTGAICGIAGLLIASRLNSAQPALGQGYELDAIAAVVIGGTSLSGGAGSYTGTALGAIALILLQSVLTTLNLEFWGRQVIFGVTLLLLMLLYGRQARLRV